MPTAAENPVAQPVDGLEPVGPARAADPRRGGGRGGDEQERERYYERTLQREPPGPPGLPSVSSPDRNA